MVEDFYISSERQLIMCRSKFLASKFAPPPTFLVPSETLFYVVSCRFFYWINTQKSCVSPSIKHTKIRSSLRKKLKEEEEDKVFKQLVF